MRKPLFWWKIPLTLLFATFALGVHAGCGGSGGRGATIVSGTVGGFSLTPVSSLGFSTIATCPRATFALAASVIEDFEVSCSPPQSEKANSTGLALGVFRVGVQQPQPIAPGAYPITPRDTDPSPDPSGSSVSVGAIFQKLEEACKPRLQREATGGSIVIRSISSTRITGTFDLNFPQDDRLTGRFDSPLCDYPFSICDALIDGGTPDAGCVP